ncbi:MAG: phenylalanine--tRNA ligase subunit beta [Bacteroidales bacterium]|nr:phenylalanine--tRNA ligase subunit beta [Bacteroidales bacterium]
MKLSYNWLKDYLKTDLTPSQVAEAMTSIGIEVDSLEEQDSIPGGLEGVVVAKVLECEPHPDSDHLHITKVDDGRGEALTVVCGAPNVAAGQKVLFARIGTVLPGDFKIKKSKIRGVESFGMICAEDELGIGTSHEGIMVLEDGAVVGTPAKEYLHLETEAVIEYEITANRIDAASHIGVARDLYAYLKLRDLPCELKYPDVSLYCDGGEGEALPVEVQDATASPRYTGTTIEGVKVAPSPEWLQKRLIAIGLKPINNIVDISNFVLFELGQPLHTFDADKIAGGKVIVRRAAEGEKLKTLDGIERSLSANDIVIADANGPMCLGGVFGGEDSGVSDSTVNILLESAYFDPGSIRKTSKKHQLQTDASFHNERGGDPLVTVYAAKRAADLIVRTAGGRVVGKMQEFCPNLYKEREIDLDYDRIEEFIGKKIGHDTIEKILECLGYGFVEKREGGARVAAPSYMVDVTRECDVVEEILRIYGYNNIDLPRHMKMSVNATPSPEPEAIRNSISNFLASNGFVETMNNSLTRADYYSSLSTFPAEACVKIVNPLSNDLNVLRQTLVLSGLEVVSYNINRQRRTMKTFEYGSVYRRLPEGDGTILSSYEEHQAFCLITTGPGEKSWTGEPKKSSFFQLKGVLELLIRRYGGDIYQMELSSAPEDIFSEGQTYTLPGRGGVLAVMGTVNPVLARKFDIRQPVFAAEISWPALFELVRRDKVTFKEMPRFPEVRRDLALLLDEGVRYSDLRKSAFKAARKILREVSLFDVYRGDKIPEGKKQYALGFVLQDLDKTLQDADVENVMNRILNTFTTEFGAELR